VPGDALRGGQPELLRDGVGFASQLAASRASGLAWPARRTENHLLVRAAAAQPVARRSAAAGA